MTLEEKELIVSRIMEARGAIYILVSGCSDETLKTIPHMPSREEWSKIAIDLMGAQAIVLNERTNESNLGSMQSISHLLYTNYKFYTEELTSRLNAIRDTIGAMEKLILTANMSDEEKEHILGVSYSINQRLIGIQNMSNSQLKHDNKQVMDMIMTLFIEEGENNGHDNNSSESSSGNDDSQQSTPTAVGVPQQDKRE